MVCEIEKLVLKNGNTEARGNRVCAMEAVAWLAGEPHSDHPACACPIIGTFMRTWNDALPKDEDRNRLLKPLLPMLVNSRSTPAVEHKRSLLALDWVIRIYLPSFLELRDELKSHAKEIRDLPPLNDENASAAGIKVSAADSAARSAARSAADSAAYNAAYSAARSAAYSAARSAADSAAYTAADSAAYTAADSAADTAARSAADSAARSAAYSAAYSAARSAARSAADSAAYSAADTAARSAADSAAYTALAPTVLKLQDSAVELVKHMVAIKE